MKKTDVYVVVDTPKKAKKLKNVLDMFGEKLYRQTSSRFKKFDLESKYKCIALSTLNEWVGFQYFDNKTEVSIKELRNILAKEHLKAGDIVLTKNGNDKIIAIVNKTCNSNVALFEAKRWIRLHDGFKCDNKGCFDDFIRYATEEEKALLDTKKELEVGKWYFVNRNIENDRKALICFQDYGNKSYGFSHGGCWTDVYGNPDTFKTKCYEYTEATPQEVEKALIEEAKRRWLVEGVKIKSDWCEGGISDYPLGDRYFYNYNENELVSTGNGAYTLFINGQWATVIEQGKFDELKEAHMNGAVIECLQITGEWYPIENPKWDPKSEYRIKPQTTFTDKDVAIIERLHDTLLDNHKYDLQSNLLIDARILADKIKGAI